MYVYIYVNIYIYIYIYIYLLPKKIRTFLWASLYVKCKSIIQDNAMTD